MARTSQRNKRTAKLLMLWLQRLNYKERYFLFRQIVGGLQLEEEFRRELSGAFDIAVPADASVFIDYHLDWLHAAVELSNAGVDGEGEYPNLGVANGTQQDVDLLVAFQSEDAAVLLIIEAKAKQSWNSGQLSSKFDRLIRIFGQAGDRCPGVYPKFALMSPRPPKRLVLGALPEWIRPDGQFPWLPLEVDPDRWVLFGSDGSMKPSAGRTNYTVMRSQGQKRQNAA